MCGFRAMLALCSSLLSFERPRDPCIGSGKEGRKVCVIDKVTCPCLKYLVNIYSSSSSSPLFSFHLPGVFTALRQMAACQMGREPALTNILPTDPLPKFVGLESTKWTIEVCNSLWCVYVKVGSS